MKHFNFCTSKFGVKAGLHLLSLITVSVLLTSCFPKTQDRPDGKDGSGGATFAVTSISGEIGGSKNIGDFPLPGEKTYNYKVCMVDYTRRVNIPNAKFLIKEIDQEATTDAQGCLNWPETVKFNYLSDSIWLQMTRTLVAKGMQRGSRVATFAINPWSHGESLPDVMDLMKQTTPYLLTDADEIAQRLAGKDKAGNLVTRDIWIESGSVNAKSGKNVLVNGMASYTWHDQVFVKPQIRFAKTDATPILVSLAHGSFKAEVSLISEDVVNGKTQRQVIATQSEAKADIINDMLMIDVDFSIAARPPRGQAIMGIKLIPIGAPEGLKPFEGVFPMGDYSHFTSSGGLEVDEKVAQENKAGQFSISQFVTGNALSVASAGNRTATAPNSDNHMETAGVDLSDFIFDHYYKINTQKDQNRSYNFNIGAQLFNNIGTVGLANTVFQVQQIDENGKAIGAVQNARSNKQSLLYWDATTMNFDMNACQHYYKMTFEVKNSDLAMDVKKTLLINPWTGKAEDLSHVTDPKQYRLECKGDSGGTEVNSIAFLNMVTFRRTSYHPQILDASLQLTQHTEYQVSTANPGILDLSNETTGTSTSARGLPYGHYLLRLVFVTNPTDRADNGYVGHADVIMNANGNVLEGEMTMDIKDLSSLLPRKMVLAQLFPISSEKYNSKTWLPNDPQIEQLIDTKTALLSPIYESKVASLGQITNPVPFMKPALDTKDGKKSVLDLLTMNSGQKIEATSPTLIHDIIAKGEAAQAQAIEQSKMNAKDPAAWKAWTEQQNIEMIRLTNASELASAKAKFGIAGDPRAELQKLIDMPKLNADWAEKFCNILHDDTWKSIIQPSLPYYAEPDMPIGIMPDSEDGFMAACRYAVQRTDDKGQPKTDSVIYKSPVYKVLRLMPGQAPWITPTKVAVTGLSVSMGFGYSKGHTEVEGTQASVGVGAELGAGLHGLGIAANAGYGAVRMVTDDKNRHSGGDVGEGASLNVTRWQFNIPTDSYQKCTLLRINPNIFLEDKGYSRFKPWTWNLDKMRMQGAVDYEKLAQMDMQGNPLTHGWLICSEKEYTQPISLQENYYMVSSGVGDNETFDSMDPGNRGFFFPIRGVSEMAHFKAKLCASREYSLKAGELTDEANQDLASQISPLMTALEPPPGVGLVVYEPGLEVPKISTDPTTWHNIAEGDLAPDADVAKTMFNDIKDKLNSQQQKAH